MSIIKMFSSTAAGAGNVLVSAQIDIPANGFIEAMSLGIAFSDATPTISTGCAAELSFLSQMSTTVNDARGVLLSANARIAFQDAARLILHGVPFAIMTPIRVKVAAGERVFLHSICDVADQQVLATAYLFVNDGIDVARAQTRRR